MRLFRSHGITRDPSLMSKISEGDWHYQQIYLGFNYRMTELQAALGISQMQRIDEFISKRHILYKRYNEFLQNSAIIKPFQLPECYSSLHLYPIQIDDKSRKYVFNELRGAGIGVNVHYIPIHTQPYYKNIGFKEGDFPNSEAYYGRTISLPLYQGLEFKLQNKIIDTINKIMVNL